jgi:LysM domain
MGSLTAHLLEPGDHGRLRFHPSCPVCRQERLYGTLSSEPVVSRRAQALLAGGVLAISSAAPAVAIGQEPDMQSEGVAAPEDPGVHELDDPSFDPGGDTELSFDTAPAPTAPEQDEDSGEGAPLDAEPTVDLDARAVPLDETGVPPSESGTPPVGEELGVPPVESVPPVEPETNSGAPPLPPVEPPAQAGEQTTTPRVDEPKTREKKRSDADAPSSPRGDGDMPQAPAKRRPAAPPAAPAAPAPAVPSPAVAPPSQAAATTPPAEPVAIAQADPVPSPVAPEPLDRNARFYVIQPGDSLWSIAKQLLGRDASAGRIAREVNRLWTLNRDRIATGDPDLLMVGTRLELR